MGDSAQFCDNEELRALFDGIEPAIMARNGRKVIVAGPCSAESREQVLDAAVALKNVGIDVFRAGIWKPRTRPGCYEGCGEIGLEWLRDVKMQTGLPVATEVASAVHAELALDAGVDVLWIGARTSVNPFAVQEIANVIGERNDVAVMVKNPANPDIELWIGAMQRFYNAGVRRLAAVHRGFSSYSSDYYRNPPQWHIPIELRRRLPGLQMLCDPSHIGGRRELVAPLAQQAYELGFDGLVVESHCHPEVALSDAAQQLTPDALGDVLRHLVERQLSDASGELMMLRERIDRLDDELLEVLGKRMALTDEIGRLKRRNNMQVLQPERYEALIESRGNKAADLGLRVGFITDLFAAIHAESVGRQLKS